MSLADGMAWEKENGSHVSQKVKEDKGFELKCLNCGSTNTTHEYKIDYDYEECAFIRGYEFFCEDCKQFKSY